jgi:hypothetical protein
MRLIAFLGIAAALAGCAGGPRVYNEDLRHAYNLGEFGYAAGRRDLQTIVRGDPFGIGEAAFEGAVVEAPQRHPPRPQPTNFTVSPGDSARANYHAVFLFDAPPATAGIGLCATPPHVPVVDTDGVVRVTAGFCRGSGVLTRVTGEVAGASGVDDPQFDALVGQVIDALFPIRNPDQDDDDQPVIVVPD